ncbi:MAG: D-alanyl-D-alanine carboxypeptidase [Proteobacteria bacterium]|nr:D-alanyl-D-alanine carboxypeptidase [Pseudomonadota bacterium]
MPGSSTGRTLARLGAALAALLVPVAASANPALLFDAASGRVLYAEDQDTQWFPASLTKIMTAYVTFDALRTGKLKLTDTVEMSEKASLQEPSKLGLPVGSEITVDLAIRALVVKSANDVAIMLAEKIGGGSEDSFVELMNKTAERLGMSRTHFENANGLPSPGQVTTARDLGRLAAAVLRDFPEYQQLWSLPDVRIGKIHLMSHNGLLKSFAGADGMKTGFICDAGFNIVASATRDGQRLIAIVLGEPSGRDRNLRAAALLDHGFETSAWKADAPTLQSLAMDPAAKGAQSVRLSVVAWDCGGRRPAAHRPHRRGVAKKAQPRAPRTAEAGAPAAAATAPAAAKPSKPQKQAKHAAEPKQ